MPAALCSSSFGWLLAAPGSLSSPCCLCAGAAAVFQDGVKALVEKGHKKITPFFIPYAITNMGARASGHHSCTSRSRELGVARGAG